METTDDKDPQTWSVDDVIQWSRKTFPFGDVLAQSLQENDVDGDILLNHIEDTNLKTDLNIKSLGQRVKIMERIRDLRNSNYLQTALITSLPIVTSPVRTRTDYLTPRRDRLIDNIFDNRRESLEFSLQETKPGGVVIARDIAGTPLSILSHFRAEKYPPTPVTLPRHLLTMKQIGLSTMDTPASFQDTPISVPFEQDFTPEPESMEQVFTPETPLSPASPEEPAPSPTEDEPVTPWNETPLTVKRRLSNSLLSSDQLPMKRRKLTPAYFGSKALPAVGVMFVPRDSPTADDKSIFIDHPTYPTGERIYVQKLMRKLLQTHNVIDFPNNNLLRTVWTLHSPHLVKKHEQHTALVFDTDPATQTCNIYQAAIDTLDIPTADKDPLRRRPKSPNSAVVRFAWDDPEPTENNPFTADAGADWDFLEKWNHLENDTLLPTFLESDDEDAVYDASTLREMQAESNPTKPNPLAPVLHPLSPTQIRSIIDEEINRFVALWGEKWRSKMEKRAWLLWRKQHRLQSKKLAARTYGDELEEVKGRIEKVRGEMEEMEWRSEEELRPVCGNLKESVDLAQELEWKVNVLTGERPAKPVKEHVVEEKEKEEIGVLDVEVESAGEDADEEDEGDDLEEDELEDEEDEEEDGLDGFIIDDEDVEMQLEEEEVEIVEEDGDMDVEMDDTPKRHKKKLVRAEDMEMDEVEGNAKDDVQMEMGDGPVGGFNDDVSNGFDNGPVGGFNDDMSDGFDNGDENEQHLEENVSNKVSNSPTRVAEKPAPASSSTTSPDTDTVTDKPPATPDTDMGVDQPIHQPDTDNVIDESDLEPSRAQDSPAMALDIPRPNSRMLTRSQTQEMSALPTPPRETEEVVPPPPKQASAPPPEKQPVIKSEKLPPPEEIADFASLDFDYDSDIPWAFGDREIAEFLQCSEASASIATDYLSRAEGQVQRAVGMYFEDLENGRVSAPAEPSTSAAPKPSKKDKSSSRKRKVVDLTDDDEPKTSQYELAPIFKPPFNDILPRGKQLRVVNALLESIRPADLHATLNEIANIATTQKIDPSTSFLSGETVANCEAYWKVYLAYTHDLFAGPLYGTPSSFQLHRMHNSDNFQKFYDRLIEYLGIRPPPPTPARKKITRDDVEMASSQVSVEQELQESPSRSPKAEKRAKKDKKGKGKAKIVKPIVRSSEQKLQEQELRRIADRERAQRKKGNFVTTTAEGDILVNPGKKVAELAVLLHPRFANVMKPHQIEGVQFMWKQIITITRGRGCLLAHTMGLGKTLQIIALLVTLSLVPRDAKLDMPQHLKLDENQPRYRRYLIVCPPSIVVNWKNEFKLWTPPDCAENLGDIYCIHPGKLRERIMTTKRWFDRGGILIMGYSQFRTLLNSKVRSEEDTAVLNKWLLEGPDIVVADEAHEIKNEKSRIGKLLAGVKTTSRIALTGSPLSNHLQEYWAMMDWIHPGFLGSLRGFTTNYITPIKDGLYRDSLAEERKFSQKRLLALKTVLDDKLLRRDLSVIEADLPKKTEFIVHVPLSPLQRQLYEKLIEEEVWERQGEKGLFKWINILRYICNHPLTLFKHIRARRREQTERRESKMSLKVEKQEVDDISDTSGDPSRAASPDSDDDELPPVDDLQWAHEIFESRSEQEQKELSFTAHSNKVRIVLEIVREAVALGENILVFVHSIPTLNYLQSKLDHKGQKTYVLTGQTPMKDRQPSIDKFNKDTKAVYLISCRAGSLGLNITSASRVILFDLAWNPVHDQQAVGRAYRLGQKKHVFVYRLGTFGTYEDIFFNENVFKLNLSKRVIDKHNPGRFGMYRDKDIAKYFKPLKDDDAAEPFDDALFEGKDSVLDKLISYSKSGKGPKLLELDLTQTFHREEEEEYLTAEDKRVAAEEAEKEKKLREEGKYVEYRTAAQMYVARDLFPEVYANPYTPISGNKLTGRIADTLAGAVEAIKNVLPNIAGLV